MKLVSVLFFAYVKNILYYRQYDGPRVKKKKSISSDMTIFLEAKITA